MAELSVLMSLYIKEKPEYAKACFDSLLNQTVQADEWVIVEDGPLSKEMYELLDEYQAKHPGLIKRIPFEKNQGLGLALRAGVPECKNELIARMDTDDIARADRFEKQLAEFENKPYLDICGSHILEFETDIEKIVSKRIVPLTDEKIKKYQKRRDGFNHMTVMFKKNSVIKAGNYQPCLLMEDSFLWARMFLSGARGINIDDFLVFARVGKDMYKRRGGFEYYKKYKTGRRKIYKTGYIGWWDYEYSVIIQLLVSIMPNKLREFVFKKILHRG